MEGGRERGGRLGGMEKGGREGGREGGGGRRGRDGRGGGGGGGGGGYGGSYAICMLMPYLSLHDDRLVVKVFYESISVRKLPKTKTKVASIPDDTIVLHRIFTSIGRREGEVGGRGGGRW